MEHFFVCAGDSIFILRFLLGEEGIVFFCRFLEREVETSVKVWVLFGFVKLGGFWLFLVGCYIPYYKCGKCESIFYALGG